MNRTPTYKGTMMKTLTWLLLASLCSLCSGDWTDSIRGYFSYKNAQCSDYSTISGTAVMSYDDLDFTALFGMEFAYQGPCMYFIGGSIDLYSYDMRRDTFGEGVCTECYGIVGCSTDGSCETFMTYNGNTASNKGYQWTGNAENRIDNETLQELKVPALALQEAVTAAVYSNQENNTPPQDDPRFYILGGAISSVSLLGLVALLERLRQRRVETAMKEVHLTGAVDYYCRV
jgi:hypothetical protein